MAASGWTQLNNLLGDHGGDAAKMARAEFAVEHILDARRFDQVFLRLRVKIGLGRREQHRRRRRPNLSQSAWKGAGYLSKSSFGPNCGAIDEDGGDHRVAMRAGLFHQADVAGVQVAHGRHEDDAAKGRRRSGMAERHG